VSIRNVTEPLVYPISLELVKHHLRILGTQDDIALSQLYIPSATKTFEAQTKRSLISRSVEQSFGEFPKDENYFLVETYPVLTPAELTVKYLNTKSEWVSFTDFTISINSFPSVIYAVDGWPSDIHTTAQNAVKVSYTAGYGANDAFIPNDIKHVLSLIIADAFAYREDSYAIPGIVVAGLRWGTKNLLAQYNLCYYEHSGQDRR
jgi:uncharacterized phiE125 gp8 family phage protein